MRAALDDAPRLHNQNLIGAPNRREPVCDHKCRAALHQITQPFLNQRFGFRIEAGSGFIEDEDARVGQNRPSDRDALLLPPGKLHSSLAHDRVVFVLERLCEFVDARDLASGENFFFRGVGPRKGHILPNCSIE